MYRGFQVTTQELEDRYKEETIFRLKGFTSTTLDKAVAVDYAIGNDTTPGNSSDNTLGIVTGIQS